MRIFRFAQIRVDAAIASTLIFPQRELLLNKRTYVCIIDVDRSLMSAQIDIVNAYKEVTHGLWIGIN